MDYKFLTVESFDDGAIRRIYMNRPETRNAQNRGLLVELDQAMAEAEADDAVRVVILGGVGPSFSSGHDLGSPDAIAERSDGPGRHPTTLAYGGTLTSLEQRYRQEWHFFFNNTMRWRNLRKIVIGQVQGKAFAAGLMVAWSCDLLVAAEDAEFADVVACRLGMCAVEYFAHPWELGPRKAKELLLTGDSVDAEEAHRLGFVSKIFKNETLEEDTLALARRIASLPSVTSLLIKDSVNQAQDARGFYSAMQTALVIHEVNHAHWGEMHNGAAAGQAADGIPVGITPEGVASGLPGWKQALPVVGAAKYAPR